MTKLTYFDFPGGRGEDCRIALHLAGVDFVDDRVSGDWMARKPDTPWGNLPVYEEDGRVIGQSNAILTYIGRKHGLHPTDLWEAARHEAVMNAVEELRVALPGGRGLSEEEKKAQREAFATGKFTDWCQRIEKQIDGPFLSGDTLMVADLKLAVGTRFYLSGAVDYVGPEYLEPFPKIRAHHDAVFAHEGVQAWYAR